MKCEGECSQSGECRGEVKRYEVSGCGFVRPFTFGYCETAVEEDRQRGFTVEIETSDQQCAVKEGVKREAFCEEETPPPAKNEKNLFH